MAHLRHLALRCRDLVRSRSFYETAIGWQFVGFFIFRVLDVIKPWPSAGFEKLPGGLGVMADDGMAALYGNLAMRGLIWITPAGWLV